MMTAANSKKSITKSSKTEKKPLTLWRKVAYILIGAAIFGVVLSVILFALDKKPATASAQMQLTFDGAAEGIAPDGRRFDIGELTSDEVIAEALKASGKDKLQICLNTPSSPAIIRAADGTENFTYMILPVRLKAGD